MAVTRKAMINAIEKYCENEGVCTDVCKVGMYAGRINCEPEGFDYWPYHMLEYIYYEVIDDNSSRRCDDEGCLCLLPAKL